MARDTEAGDGSCVMSLGKVNNGPRDIPSLRYRIESAEVPTLTGPSSTGRLVFTGESERSVEDILSAAAQPPEDRTERDEAAEWLRAYIDSNGGEVAAKDAIRAARAEGIAERTLYRARARAKVTSAVEGFPARSVWRLQKVADTPSSASSATALPCPSGVAELAELGDRWQNSARSVTDGADES
jgi:hypothetical protein